MSGAAADIERFRRAIGRRLGLEVGGERFGLLETLFHRRARGDGAAYLAMLEAAPSAAELAVLAQELTVNETSFFRHPEQIRAVAETVLPARAAARDGPVRILSAGCASGEEAFTLAACARDCAALLGREIEILGVDINPAMLRKAVAARYSEWSLRQTPDDLRARFFRRDGDAFVLDEMLRSMVRFESHNLVVEDGDFWTPGRFDLVFCRNVLMYFAPDTARAAIGRIARSLAPGGYLFLGYAETLRGLSDDFELCNTHDSFYYRRKAGGQAVAQRIAIPVAPRPPAPAPIATPAPERPRRRRVPPRPRAAPELAAVADAIVRERFDDAAAMLRRLLDARPPEGEALLLAAILETHGGDIAAAERLCGELLARETTHAGAHYLLALCLEARADAGGAAQHHRAAADSDPGFAMPRLHLGMLARREGDLRGATRTLRRALLLLEREEEARLRLYGGGFGRAALAALCRAELAACGGGQ